jgi:hypothetical protein
LGSRTPFSYPESPATTPSDEAKSRKTLLVFLTHPGRFPISAETEGPMVPFLLEGPEVASFHISILDATGSEFVYDLGL